jgi:uncharacterized protein (DUF1501 family)
MGRMTRRELLAWMSAGTASTVAGVAWLDGGDGSAAPPQRRSSSSEPADQALPDPGGSDGTEPPSTTEATPSEDPPASDGERLLVVVEMPGGNDGLSMVVPYGDGGYYDARPTTAIAERDVIAIDDRIGLHPALERIAARGTAAVIGVGAAEPDGSHFEMMQRWWRGDPAPAVEGLGWVGRLADVLDDGSSVASALTIGTGSHPILRAERASTLAIPGADAAWYLAGGDEGVQQVFQRGVRSIGESAGSASRDGYFARIAGMSGRTVSLAEQLVGLGDEELGDYPDTQLGRSLWFTRRLFQLGGGVRVVHVVMDGDFDTHENHGGRHPELMAQLDAAVGAFWDDLDATGLSGRVALMTTSEFGRTVHENGSAGLDHGAASSMLVMGPVTPGVIGEAPSITDLDDNDDQIATATFDGYLGAVVEGWLGVPVSEVFPGSLELLPLEFA